MRLANERALIVWDPAHHREHFIRKPSFEGDPRSFGFFVPTPTTPDVAKEADSIIDRVAAIVSEPGEGTARVGLPAVPSGGGVDVVQRVRIDDFEVATLRAADASALGDWLGAHGFVDSPALRGWATAYVDKKWLVNAVRYAPNGDAARHTLDTPTLRFSFTIDAPFYPYTEPRQDGAAEDAYYKRYGTGCPAGDPLCVSRQGRFVTRPLEIYVVAPRQMQSTIEERTDGPPVLASVLASSASVADALGDTSKWGFDPGAEKAWAVTYLYESRIYRNALHDVTFAEYDLPPPEPAKGVDPQLARRWRERPRPVAVVESRGGAGTGRFHRVGAWLLLRLVISVVGFAIMSERE